MTGWYREDLAYIHHVGHADFALEVAPGILEILRQSRILEGLVVDLGCGSGLWARELVDAGYRVLDIDISAAMVEISGLLQGVGFGVRTMRSYGSYPLAEGHAAFVARKPA